MNIIFDYQVSLQRLPQPGQVQIAASQPKEIAQYQVSRLIQQNLHEDRLNIKDKDKDKDKFYFSSVDYEDKTSAIGWSPKVHKKQVNKQ